MFLAFSLANDAHAASVNLAWDANTESNLAGYNVYRSSQSGVYSSAPLNGALLLTSTSFTDSSASSGTYYYVVKAVSTTAQESYASNEVQVSVSTLAPPPPTLTAPTGLTSSCSSDAKQFTISWNPVSGAQSYYVRVDNIANNVGSTWYVTDGVDFNLDAYVGTSFTGAAIAGQAYGWWVHPYNSTSGIGPSSSGQFTCTSAPPPPPPSDTTAPSVSISNPTNGSTVPPGGSVTVTANASDNVGVVGVQFKLNGANLGLEVTTAPYAVAWNVKKGGGSYTLQAVARDAAGNRTTSATVTVKAAKGNNLETVDGAPLDGVSASYARVELEQAAASNGAALITMKNGESIVSETAIPASAAILQGRVYVNVNDVVNTGLSIVNPQAEPVDVSFYLTDNAGINFGHGSFTLDGAQQVATFLTREPFNVAGSIEGTLTFESSAPIAFAAFRSVVNEAGDFSMTALPVGSLETLDGPTVLTHFVAGDGWSTQIVLTNPTDLPLAGSIAFVESQVEASIDYAISPRSFVRLAVPTSAAGMVSGYAVVRPSGNSSTPNSFALLSYAKDGLTTPPTAVSVSALATTFTAHVSSALDLRTAVSFANPSASPAVLTLRIGEMSTTLQIAAGGHVASFVDELFPATAGAFEGALTIESSAPIAATSLRLRTNDRGNLLLTAMPVASTNSSDLIFPLVLSGGGYSTDFVGIR